MGKTNKINTYNPIEELWKMSPLGTDSIHYPKKSLSVRKLSFVENKDTYTLKLEVNAKNLQSNNAVVYIKEQEILVDEIAKEFYNQTINPNGKAVLTLEFKKKYLNLLSKTDLEGEFEFYAKLFCDDMTASTNIFRLPAQKTSTPEKNTQKKKNEVSVVTFHIYWNSEKEGKIEKHIPKTITKGYEDKIKYVYHDKGGKEHEICMLDKHMTKEKKDGEKLESKPEHSKVIYDNEVSEGQTKRRVLYENGDISEYGYNKGENFWRLYRSKNSTVELIQMPDNLIGPIVFYTFSNTQRRYTGMDVFAGFIGALAECGFKDIVTTGSCFKEATCFPSAKHVNGKSIDTLYLDRNREQAFINALKKFHFIPIRSGIDDIHSYPETEHDNNHNDHLHSEFDRSKIIIIYK